VLKALTGLVVAPKLFAFGGDALAAPLVLAQAGPRAPDPAYLRMLDRIKNILVIYMENRSFDNIFGEFPGANGLSRAAGKVIQTDGTGRTFDSLPPSRWPFNIPENAPELRAVESLANLPNRPFAIDGVRPGVTWASYTRDLVHRFYNQKVQVNGSKMDRFVQQSDAAALAMGYYSGQAMQRTNMWQLAREGVLMDNFFQSAAGGSFLNHIWLICGQSPIWRNAPASQRSRLDGNGVPISEGRMVIAEHGDFCVNTTQSVFFNDGRQGENLLPAQTMPTIGDRLTARGIDWTWYAGGWELAAKPNRSAEETALLNGPLHFVYHHQPFTYFDRFNPNSDEGKAQSARHFKSQSDLDNDIAAGTLPPVAFYKPVGVLNQHPGNANLQAGDEEIGRIVRMLRNSPLRRDFAVLITYDEFGGFWDHVPPPAGPAVGSRADFHGPGPRIPAIFVSPHARRGAIDSTPYDTTAVLKLIQDRFRLEPLPSERVNAQFPMARVFG
jgi:phospholipase C